MNSKEFSLTIENIVKEKKISHMDAVIWYCEQNGLDPSQVSSLISKSLNTTRGHKFKNVKVS